MKIIIPSHHTYADAWEPFIELFRRFWPNCKFPVILITDKIPDGQKTNRWDNVVTLGADGGWCLNIVNALGMSGIRDESHYLMMQEDFFLNSEVDAVYVDAALDFFNTDSKTGCFRLYPCPGPDYPVDDSFGIIDQIAAYKCSCQAAIWKRELLLSLLKECDTPASFEIHGTRLAHTMSDKFVSARRTRLPWVMTYFCSAINRGKWNPQAIEWCTKHGISIDTSRRPIDSAPSK